MGSRGSGFALGQPPTRDAAGHNLPSDRSMQFVAVDLLCRVCYPQYRIRFVRLAIDSWHDSFDIAHVYQRGPSSSFAEEGFTADGQTWVRYKCRCPHCGNAPVVRAERVMAALEAAYERGAIDKVVSLPI
jgi:hypothetical protein